MFFGETKFKELLDRLEQQIGNRYIDSNVPKDEIEDRINDTKLKLTELFMSRYAK